MRPAGSYALTPDDEVGSNVIMSWGSDNSSAKLEVLSMVTRAGPPSARRYRPHRFTPTGKYCVALQAIQANYEFVSKSQLAVTLLATHFINRLNNIKEDVWREHATDEIVDMVARSAVPDNYVDDGYAVELEPASIFEFMKRKDSRVLRVV